MWVAGGMSAGDSSRTQNRVPENATASFHPPTNTPGAISDGVDFARAERGFLDAAFDGMVPPRSRGGRHDSDGTARGRLRVHERPRGDSVGPPPPRPRPEPGDPRPPPPPARS